MTHALLFPSFALNNGSNPAGLTTDQRGMPRASTAFCKGTPLVDIGSYEDQGISHSGDFDGGGLGLSDVPLFVEELLSPTTWESCIADMNFDGRADGRDIPFFIAALL